MLETSSKAPNKILWMIIIVAAVAGFAIAVAQDASIISSVGIGVVAGLVILFAFWLLNRKKAPV